MTNFKLLHAADLHLDSPFEALSPEAGEARRSAQRRLLFRLAELTEERGASALLLCGDVFDSDKIALETERDFCRALGALPCPVLVAPGNHDPFFPGSVWDRMKMPPNVHVFKTTEIQCLELPGIPARFFGAGFQNSFCPPLLRGFSPQKKQEGLWDIMLLHGDVCPGKSDYNPISPGDISACGMDYLALGHIHTRDIQKSAQGVCYAYPGCGEGRGFDELGEMGALLVGFSETGISTEFIPLGGARYEIISLDLSDSEPLEAALLATEQLSKNDYCRLILSGECLELPNIQALRSSLEGRFAELQIRDNTRQKRDIWELAGQDTLSGVFLKKLGNLLENAQTDNERKKLELAAAYGIAAIENGGETL
ncbi:MAG: DNA repair exonuclease [Oscillospiraceae bacterium]